MTTSPHASETGIVVIGRNEGARLRGCLQSLVSHGCPVVYVDSGSSDGSVALARGLCEAVVELDPSTPFSAARARNEGAQGLMRQFMAVRYVQFLDGDCTLQPEWLQAAQTALAAEPDCAVVIGHLQERAPEASPYNRLCALEWRSPAGLLSDFGALGGIMLMRCDVFRQLGGFNPEVIAGEDSELGVRVGLAGFKVRKIDAAMAVHDADIHRFGQWWTRNVRAGHAIGQRSQLNGASNARDCMRERRGTWLWGILLPAVVALAAPASHGRSLWLLAGYGALAWRIARFRLGRGDTLGESLMYACFTVLGKVANGVGLLKFYLNRVRGQFRIIEYK